MSADAKMWPQTEVGWHWCGICDARPSVTYEGTLDEVLVDIYRDMECTTMRWEIRLYPNGLMGLRGFIA